MSWARQKARYGLAWILEEAARSRRARTRSSAKLGSVLKHLGFAKTLQATADRLREEDS